MAVQNSEYLGMWNFTPYSRSVAGNTLLHCGSNVRLPIITKSDMPEPIDESIDALHQIGFDGWYITD